MKAHTQPKKLFAVVLISLTTFTVVGRTAGTGQSHEGRQTAQFCRTQVRLRKWSNMRSCQPVASRALLSADLQKRQPTPAQ